MPFETACSGEEQKTEKWLSISIRLRWLCINQIWLSVGVIQAARKTGVKVHARL